MLSSSNRTQSFNYSVKAPWQVLVQDHGVESRNIMFLNLVCCPEGLKAMAQAYPEIHIITGRRHIKSISISDQYLFIEPGSGQKSQSGSRRPLNPDPDPSYFLTLSKDNIKLFHNYKFSHQKEPIERYRNIVEKGKLWDDLTFKIFFKPPDPDPDSESGSETLKNLFLRIMPQIMLRDSGLFFWCLVTN